MPILDIPYEQLPQAIKDNLSEEQWKAAQPEIIAEGEPVPEATQYINIKNGLLRTYGRGEIAEGPLLPTHDLSGAGGKDSTQFEGAPAGAEHEPAKHHDWDVGR